MAQTLLLADIEAAKAALLSAENELHAAMTDSAAAPRAAKALPSEVIRAAASNLSVAKAKLVGLTAKLDALTPTVAVTKIEAASAAIAEAEKYLDKVLGELDLDAEADTTLVNKVVQDAFTKLRISRETLAELESMATDEA